MIAVEIERKFLVDVGKLPPLGAPRAMEQAYLSFSPVVRVRIDSGKAFITVKSRGLKVRREVEVEIPLKEARALLEMRAEKTLAIRKRRYIVDFQSKKWEIDVFEGEFEGLVVAEVELANEAEVVTIPPWVKKEVTDDPAYQNANMARKGPEKE